ncbi:hypothetical protein DYH09_28845 [bacterium CPR1]|nr:hypothetical protein [bacterium CPR1]
MSWAECKDPNIANCCQNENTPPGANSLHAVRTVVLRNLERARQFPLQAPSEGRRRGELEGCESCGGKVQEVLFTTEPALWSQYPLALDGWVCPDCGEVITPRYLEPEEAEALFQNGLSAAETGRWEEAERALRRLCNSWPRYAPARVYLAQVLMLQDESRVPPEVDAHLEAALSGEGLSNQAPLAELLARARLTRGDVEGALQAIARCSLEPEHAVQLADWARGRGDLYDRGSKALIELLEQGQPPREEVARAVDDLLEHLQHRPDSWAALWLAGRGQALLQELEASCVLLRRASQLQPEHPDVLREYCLALLRVGLNEDALEPARKARELRPEDAGLVTNLAVAELLAGDPDAAKALAERALRLNPKDANNRSLLLLLEDVCMGRCQPPRSLGEISGRESERGTIQQ